MLTRLRVSGFKNLVDVDIRFGPFTCIAGVNGVGKSNLLDAITFLSALADKPLIEAALSVRESGRTDEIRSLFHQVGQQTGNEMLFEAEMIVPKEAVDDLGQPAKATTTFLRYSLELRYRRDDTPTSIGGLEIVKEELDHVKRSDAAKQLLFPHDVKAWRTSVLRGRRTGKPNVASFISTSHGDEKSRVIKLHQDGKTGRARQLLAAQLPRTALSAANAAETPTATVARREMQSWRLLQLEPSSLRAPDPFTAPTRLAPDGGHLAATLYYLARRHGAVPALYSRVANRLSELIDDVKRISVDKDDQRELLTLRVTGLDGTTHSARALSDGTLRFLALAVLEQDPDAGGVICLEEPENGIHPKRIPAMLRLLHDISMDVRESVGPENPLRQVIVNTHSPSVVAQVSDDSLLMAEAKEIVSDDQAFQCLSFSCLPNTWRARSDTPTVDRGTLLAYLSPVALPDWKPARRRARTAQAGRPRVIDREDLQMYLDYGGPR